MLQIIRSTAGSWVVKILFVVLIISFAVWGIGDITRGVETGVAKVGDTNITPQELDREFKAEINRLRQVMGPDFNETKARQLGLVDRALEQLIQRTLLLKAAEDAGIRIGDQTVVDMVSKVPAFKNGLGQFDPALMRALLAQNGYTEHGFAEQVRADLAQGDIAGAITAGTNVPRTLAEQLFRYREEARRFDLVTIPNTAMPDAPAPEEAVLAQFHQDKAVRYTAPEYRDLTVGLIEAAALAKEIQVSDEQRQEYYDAHQADYVTAERRSLTQIVFPDKAAADKALAAIQGGKTLEQVAKDAKQEAVKLEDVLKADLPAELAEPVFTAEQGKVTGPVESPYGFHVALVSTIKAGGTRTLAEVKDEVTTKVRQEKSIDKLYEASTKLEDALANGTPVADAVKEFGGRTIKLEGVDNQGKDKMGVVKTDGLPTAEAILTNAFSLPEGQNGSVAEAGNDAFYVVHVDAVTPSALKPLAEVKGQVLADWQAEQKAATAKKKAEEVAEKLRAGATPKDAAAGITGALVQRSEPMRRAGGPNLSLPASLFEPMFAAKPDTVAVGASSSGQVVAKLVEIIPADPSLVQAATAINMLSSNMAEAMASDLMLQYLAGLRARYGVTINRSVIDTMYRPQE
ncbi:hypothetical protein GE253_00205 [Niveispirillum sp. SYP-B3756]|uniref:peptidylprolyl isomerase n=1 Tax=Niveispirillum sp. SYP-B3756 TaxID=2662178 RepID=UPI0012910D7A|nr:peptidylprolyl isomerase [Niveispirillum sp. SYP-B3756]MQP63758.1 hypothetical protein [Niveispirillum sp. SYP-B3756]